MLEVVMLRAVASCQKEMTMMNGVVRNLAADKGTVLAGDTKLTIAYKRTFTFKIIILIILLHSSPLYANCKLIFM